MPRLDQAAAASAAARNGPVDNNHCDCARDSDGDTADVKSGDVTVAEGHADESTYQRAGNAEQGSDDKTAQAKTGSATKDELRHESSDQTDKNPG